MAVHVTCEPEAQSLSLPSGHDREQLPNGEPQGLGFRNTGPMQSALCKALVALLCCSKTLSACHWHDARRMVEHWCCWRLFVNAGMQVIGTGLEVKRSTCGTSPSLCVPLHPLS